MCFIGEEKDKAGKFKKRVAVIDEKGHHKASLSGSHIALEPLVETDVITFSLGAAPARTTPLFQDALPHLQDITEGGVLYADIDAGNEHREVVAYVVLPGGMLDVYDMYDRPAQYKLDGDDIGLPKCVARITKLEINASNPVTVTITDRALKNPNRPKQFTVPENSFVCVANVTQVLGQRHLAHHRPLTNGAKIAEVSSLQAGTCAPHNGDLCHSVDADGTNPECSNSQYP